jgi:hypothetical protein
MKTKLLTLVAAGLMVAQMHGQVIYSETFDGLTLTTNASAVPSSMVQINADGKPGNTGASNAPFNAAPYLSTGWAVYKVGSDTAAMSTSWTNPAGVVDRWLITPAMSGLTAATILTWEGLAPDASYPDGYEVWVSAAAGASSTPVASDFTAIGSNQVFTLASEAQVFTAHSVSLAAFAGQTVRIAFRNHSNDMFHLFIDDIKVLNPAAKEGMVTGIIMNKYVLAGPQTVQATFKSMGGPTVTSATLKYSIDGGAPVTQTFSPGIGYGASYNASFTTAANLTVGLRTIKAWVTDINGTGPDATPSNDTATIFVTVQATKPAKNVVVEEFTGAWCGYCPRGATTLAAITAADPKVIGVAIHDNDQMSTTESDVIDVGYSTGYPSGCIDRSYIASQGDYAVGDNVWGAEATTRENAVVPASIALSGISFNAVTRVISATVTATFFGDVKGPYALNCFVIENNIYGPIADQSDNMYNQHSYFYTTAGSPYLGVGLTSSPWSTSVAGMMPSDYVHKHVLDKMIGGSYGDNTVIPTTLVPSGSTFSKTFTYTLPAANPGGAFRYNPDNIYLVGMIMEYSTTAKADRYILNAEESKLNTNAENMGAVAVNSIEATFGTVSVYPNPANTTANVAIELNNNENVAVNVYNAVGQLVFTQTQNNLGAGNHVISFNAEELANGIYNIVVSTNNGSVTKKITIAK